MCRGPKDLQLTWSGGNANVAVFGSSADPSTNALTAFTCVAPAGANQITVPAWVQRLVTGRREGQLPFNRCRAFTACALPGKRGRCRLINWAQTISKNVVYQ